MGAFSMPPMSLKNIRSRAATFRKVFSYTEYDCVDIVAILESMPDRGVEYEILPREDMGDKHGQTFPMANRIYIREDIYNGACDGCPRDRLTIAHEIGHLILHKTDNLSLARVPDDARIPVYCDSEWQADVFAGELLAPHEAVKRLSIEQICDRYNVSRAAAQIQRKR